MWNKKSKWNAREEEGGRIEGEEATMNERIKRKQRRKERGEQKAKEFEKRKNKKKVEG